MDIQWVFDPDQITVGDVITLQDKGMAERMKVIASKCAFDPNTGQLLDSKEVLVYLHGLSLTALNDLLKQFRKATELNDPN